MTTEQVQELIDYLTMQAEQVQKAWGRTRAGDSEMCNFYRGSFQALVSVREHIASTYQNTGEE